ncbi:MAG TPA: type II secretion system protein GspE, partial [Actinomycetota bacterium]|nr:type II secretion system protein GspE [Actinomycetota bacterium]
MQTRRDLGEILIEEGLIDQANLELALAEEARSGKSAWKVLLEQGQVTERDLLRARAAQIGLDFSDLAKEQPDADAIALVPEDVIRRQIALPMSVLDGALVVAMADPRNHLAVEELAQVSGKQIVPAVAYRADLTAAIERAFSQPNPPPPPPPGHAAPPPTS